MSITNILYKTLILLVCSLIQVFGVLIEGISKLFAKFSELLEEAHDNLIDTLEPKKVKKSIDISL